MATIAELRARRETLSASRSSGVARVSYDGRSVEYRSLAEIDFRRRHPGDSTDRGTSIPETVRVPASEVLHIYRPIDAGQIRGLPHVAPAMVRLFLLGSTTTPSSTGRRPRPCSRAS